MRVREGDAIVHPDTGRQGLLLQIQRNPACLMRYFVIQWVDDGTVEELEEWTFGPIDDDEIQT